MRCHSREFVEDNLPNPSTQLQFKITHLANKQLCQIVAVYIIDKFAFSNVKRSKITLVTVTMFTLRAADQLFENLPKSF